MSESRIETEDHGSLVPVTDRESGLPVFWDSPRKGGTSRSLTLRELVNVLFSRKWSLAIATAIFVAIGGVATMLETPIFESRTTVEIQTAGEVSPDLGEYGGRGSGEWDGFIQTQIHILESGTLRRRVDRVLEKTPGRTSGWHRPPNRLQTGLSELGVNLPQLFPAVSKGTPPVKLDVRLVPNTHLVDITCDSPDGVHAAQYANALAAEFNDAQMESRWAAAQSASRWLNNQILDVQQKLRQSEHDLERVTQKAGLLFNPDQDSGDQVKLRQLQEESSRATGNRMLKQSEFETAQNSPIDSVPQIVDDGSLTADRAKLADLRRQLADMRQQMTPEHYKVKQTVAQIDEVQATLNQERQNILLRMRNDYKAAVRRENLLRTAADKQEGVVSAQSQGGISADVLRREVESNRKLYDDLLQKAKTADLAAAVRSNTVRIIDPAVPSSIPVKPDQPRNLLMSLVAGFLLSALVIVESEHANRRFRAPGETTLHLDVPELGAIPEHESLQNSSKAGRKGSSLLLNIGNEGVAGTPTLIDWQNNPTFVMESFRSTITSILGGELKKGRSPVIVVTSCDRGEGKSTTTSHLACALAEIKRRVVLVDADMRKPQLNQLFGIPNTWGLSDLLSERNSLGDACLESLARPTRIEGLYLLPTGPGSSNSWSLLNSHRMAELIVKLREKFDAVLIDTAPMSYMADARVLGRLADGVVLVVRAGATTREQAIGAKERLQADGSCVLGTVLNRWDPRARASYGYAAGGYEDKTRRLLA